MNTRNSVKLSTLLLVLLVPLAAMAQIPYGNNPDAGHYFDSDGVKLYYEIYGQGEPLLMLHGGVFGYISEYEHLIPKLAGRFQVICLATRGHGKSEIGHESFTYLQRAEDARRLLLHLKISQATVLGFSDGGFAGLMLAAQYPELVTKLIAMGVGDKTDDSESEKYYYTSQSLLAEYGDYFRGLVKLMPEPDRWDECLSFGNDLYNEHRLSTDTFAKIKCPVLIMNGDHDNNGNIDPVIRCYKSIPNAQLSIIPGCGHVIFYCNLPAVWKSMQKFLQE